MNDRWRTILRKILYYATIAASPFIAITIILLLWLTFFPFTWTYQNEVTAVQCTKFTDCSAVKCTDINISPWYQQAYWACERDGHPTCGEENVCECRVQCM